MLVIQFLGFFFFSYGVILFILPVKEPGNITDVGRRTCDHAMLLEKNTFFISLSGENFFNPKHIGRGGHIMPWEN